MHSVDLGCNDYNEMTLIMHQMRVKAGFVIKNIRMDKFVKKLKQCMGSNCQEDHLTLM